MAYLLDSSTPFPDDKLVELFKNWQFQLKEEIIWFNACEVTRTGCPEVYAERLKNYLEEATKPDPIRKQGVLYLSHLVLLVECLLLSTATHSNLPWTLGFLR